jgi:hypothetical protein
MVPAGSRVQAEIGGDWQEEPVTGTAIPLSKFRYASQIGLQDLGVSRTAEILVKMA